MNSQFTAQTRVLHVGKVSAGSLQVLVLDKRVEVQILSSALQITGFLANAGKPVFRFHTRPTPKLRFSGILQVEKSPV